jgi:hypothetical protein
LDRQAEVRAPSRGYFLDIVAGMLRLDRKTAAPVLAGDLVGLLTGSRRTGHRIDQLARPERRELS